jgi:hypothetical protein
MSGSASGKSPIGFGIFDFLTRVIPGTLISGAFVLTTYPDTLNSSVSNFGLVIFLVMSFLIGEIINALRISLYPVPRAFTRMVFSQSDGQTQISRADLVRRRLPFVSSVESNLYTHTKDDLWEELKENHDMDDFWRIRDVYFIFLDSIEPNFTRRMRRLQAMYHLTVNMSFSGAIAVGMGVYIGIIKPDPSSFVGSILLLLLVIPILVLLTLSLGGVENMYVINLVRQYYLSNSSTAVSK